MPFYGSSSPSADGAGWDVYRENRFFALWIFLDYHSVAVYDNDLILIREFLLLSQLQMEFTLSFVTEYKN